MFEVDYALQAKLLFKIRVGLGTVGVYLNSSNEIYMQDIIDYVLCAV